TLTNPILATIGVPARKARRATPTARSAGVSPPSRGPRGASAPRPRDTTASTTAGREAHRGVPRGRPPGPAHPLRRRDTTASTTAGREAHRGVPGGRPPGLALEQSADQGGGLARGLADPDAGLLQGFLLGLRRARGARDDRAGVPHRLALRGGETGHV